MSVRAGGGPRGLSPARDAHPVLAAAVPDQSDGSAGAGSDPTDLEAGGGEAGVGDAAVALLCPHTDLVLLVGQVEALRVVEGVKYPGGAWTILLF